MLELFAVTSSTFQLLLEVPITSCTAQPQSRSAFCFISLIKFLNLAGVLELFSVTSSTFQSLLQVPITTRTAQIHPRSALCFISLIKSLNLAGLLQYLVITSLTFQLLLIINATTWTPSPSNAHSPRAMHHWLGLVLLAGYWSSSQNLTTESRSKLTRRSCIPQQASASAQSCQCCSALAGTGKGPAKQLINLM